MITKFSSFGYSNRNGIDYNKLASGRVSSARYLSKLASAESRGAVNVLKSNLRREIYKIKKNGGDETQVKAAVARIKSVMRKADEKIIKLSGEERMKERIKQAEYVEKRLEQQSIIKKYISKVYNRKVSERLNITRIAVYEDKEIKDSEQYSDCAHSCASITGIYTVAGITEIPAANIAEGKGNSIIDVMV